MDIRQLIVEFNPNAKQGLNVLPNKYFNNLLYSSCPTCYLKKKFHDNALNLDSPCFNYCSKLCLYQRIPQKNSESYNEYKDRLWKIFTNPALTTWKYPGLILF